jgi:O-antigen/teichoic acid export membrane protein
MKTQRMPSELHTPHAAPFPRGAPMLDRASDLLVRAGRKSFWPLADQGVVSAGNFLTLVIVARALPARSEYGVFGLLLECIFYFNTLQSALVAYPLTLRGATSDDDDALRPLAGAALLLTLAMAVPLALAGAGAAALGGQTTLGLSAAFALVAWQAQDVVRKALVARFRYADAVAGDALRYLGTAACAFAMWRAGALTLQNVFVVIGAFSLLGLAVQAWQVRPRAVSGADLTALARAFWHAGRWMLLTSATTVFISICGVWAISLFHGNDLVGQFYAVANFTKPINPVILTFCGLVVQHAAKAYDAGGAVAAKRIAMKFALLTGAVTLPYLTLLVALPGPAMRLLYGPDSHFRDPQGLFALRLFAAGFVLFIVLSLIGSLLNGIGRTRDSFHAQVVNSVATVAIALPLTIRYGLIGMILGGILAAAVQLVAMVYLYRRAT